MKDNKVYKFTFEHSSYEVHACKLLDRLEEPIRLVMDYEASSINRRFFNGERAIRMLETVLGFESTLASTRSGGYINNRAVGYEGATQ